MVSDWVRDGVRDYKRGTRRKAMIALAFVGLIFLICVFSLSVSRVDITFGQAFEVVVDHITGNLPDKETDYPAWLIDNIVIDDNAPRTVAGVCVGGILAVSGAIMQSVTRNPLTDPYTLGISSAAMCGVAAAVTLGFSLVPGTTWNGAIIMNAFLFSLIPAFVIVTVTTIKRMSSTSMILIGIALMYMFSAFSTFLKFNAETEELEEIYMWGLGTLTGIEWSSVQMLIIGFALLLLCSMFLANRINALSAGDNVATSLGENPLRVRITCFILVSLATAVAVCFSGTIGFVGLVGPHIARLFIGSNSKMLVPTSAICGALIVVGADCLVRMLPHVLPVGVITALIGSPIFLFFLYKQKRKMAW